MVVFKWIFRIIKSILFGAVCGAGIFIASLLVFGILQLFCGWSEHTTNTLIWICTGGMAIWGFVFMIRDSMEMEDDRKTLNEYKKKYEEVSGEKYTYIPKDDLSVNKSSVKHDGSYFHTDRYGMPTGFSNVDESGAENYSWNDYSVSHKSKNDVVHYGKDGIQGMSHISSDGKNITHYGKDCTVTGYSKKNDDGTIDHFDKYGRYSGSSKK